MAPPKPPQPTPQEIIEQAVQTSNTQLANAVDQIHSDLDDRFVFVQSDLDKTHQNLQEITTKMDNDRQISDSRYDSIMSTLQKLLLQQPAATTAATNPTSSGMKTVLSPIPTLASPLSGIASTSTTPPRTTTTIPFSLGTSQIPWGTSQIPSFTYNPHNHVSTAFTPYTFIPTSLPPPSPYNIPFPNPHTYSPPTNLPPLPPFRSPKLELSLFDGSNPLEWLFQADQFFGFYNMPPENRLSMMSFYMKGDALGWFKWMHHNRLLTDWASFTRALELRFGPSTFANHQAELFKLKQTNSVVEYQAAFEKLGNQVVGLSHDAILNCFISGLIPEIQNEIAIHKPTSISQAIGLSKLIESKLRESKPKYNKPFPDPFPKPPTQPTPPIPSTPPKTNTTIQPNKFPIRRLSNAQLQERRAQGLCFNCDEKFIAGHKCSAGKFLLLLVDEDEILQQDTSLHESEHESKPVFHSEQEETYFQLSPQAACGHLSPKTLKFRGSIFGLPVTVLIDTGSTHNILQPRIAHHLKLQTTPIPNFSVMVGNGSKLNCSGLCQQVPLTLQDNLFTISFHLLPIEGADIVLGMEWLRTLGPLMADFSIPKLSFTYNDNDITITGDSKTLPTPSSFHQICHLLHNDSIASLHLLICQPTPAQDTLPSPSNPDLFDSLPSSLSPQITTLLKSFPKVFHKPHGLPPSRPHDHHIPLLPNTTPVNVKPYRYPHSQKDAMTVLIQDMLAEGIIKPSQSPYSSPVLLVRKKDGSWRFCVDYRALNAVTVRDRFPIPTIDEIFDELGSATIFSKIDLRSGYHQIRVTPADTHKTAFRTFDGHYEFLVMPFGLTNAPSSFQSAMNDLLRPFLRRFVLVFFDDILIYSSCLTDHAHHLSLILNLLSVNQFYAKLSKCVFAVPSVDYLGHIISSNGVTPDPTKIQAIMDWPRPRSLTTLRGFLGLTGFYRRFVRHYASLAAPLTDLLRHSKFTWNESAEAAFTNLKHKIVENQV
ncbi:uncharacterized protein LOC131614818 [Vicia villosa]|uniref:uncharacterized protein LOC131614818 n=1 Tax=Vicia villosa TaxID=3911 RepID=UPI00273AEDEF|nr:uncharacterized protein LOC131614818 [Vicia villosa]